MEIIILLEAAKIGHNKMNLRHRYVRAINDDGSTISG